MFLTSKNAGIAANYVKALRSFFRFLQEQGLWHVDPTRHLRLPKVAYRERRVPSEQEVFAILSQPMKLRDRIFLVLCVNCGLRRLEAATVKLNNIDMQRRRIIVLGKGDKERVVQFSATVAPWIQEYVDEVRAKHPQSEYLFPPVRSDSALPHADPEQFGHRLEAICKRAGVARYTPHQLRHFFVDYALDHGADLKAVSQYIGHADVLVTLQVYRHVGQQRLSRLTESFVPLAQGMLTAGEHLNGRALHAVSEL